MWKLAILGETQYLNGCIASYKLFIYLFVLFCFFFAEFQTVHRGVESAIVWRISGSRFV